MRYFLIACFFMLSILNASNILNVNIYENENDIDIVLALDAPFDGKVIQKKDTNGVFLNFSKLKIDNSFDKTVNSPILQQITIDNIDSNQTAISLKSDQLFDIAVSKTSDGFGLRIKISILATTISIEDIAINLPNQSSNERMFLEIMYICTIFIVFLIILFLILWRKKIFFIQNRKPIVHAKESWFFGSLEDNPDVVILFKKYLDNENYVLLFEFNDERFLVLLGKSNILLEKYNNNSHGKFEIFGENKDKTNINIFNNAKNEIFENY